MSTRALPRTAMVRALSALERAGYGQEDEDDQQDREARIRAHVLRVWTDPAWLAEFHELRAGYVKVGIRHRIRPEDVRRESADYPREMDPSDVIEEAMG